MKYRVELDTMGEVKVPADALYGAQTQRAIENFPVSGLTMGREIVRAIALIKRASAEVNLSLGKLDSKIADAIIKAAREVADGSLDRHFPVDVYQTGSGTSTNMNANEVISNRAIQLMGGEIGSKKPVHPNDHVNMGQSSNDVFPTAIHVAAVSSIENALLPALEKLKASLDRKAKKFHGIIKIGRTHLQDATPIRLGQEFGGYASQIEHGIAHIESTLPHLRELAIGGTAVGTGINTHPDFGKKVAKKLAAYTKCKFVEAPNHFEAQSSKDAIVATSGALKTVAVSLIKIANDIRWMGSGPRLGLGELELPELQPGSSIMPGKVNPVAAEALIMVCAQVIGYDAAITLSGLYGNFELNVMMPLMAHNVIGQIGLLSNAVALFESKLVAGLKARAENIRAGIDKSLALVTALAPVVGYDRAAEISKEAYASGKTIRQILIEKNILPVAKIDEILNPETMAGPGKK